MPFAPVMGEGVWPRVQPYRSAARVTCGDHRIVHRGVADDPAFAHFLAAGLELGFHQRDQVGARREQRRQRRKNVAQRDERRRRS